MGIPHTFVADERGTVQDRPETAQHPYPGYYSLVPAQWEEAATWRPPLLSVNCWHIGPVTDYARTSCLETFLYCAAEKNTSGRSLK